MFTVPLPKAQLQKQTLFTSNETAGNVYRIPALLYERESKTLFAFAEQRKTSDNASGEKLVIRTGKIKEGSSKKTVGVILKEVEKVNNKLFLFFICVEDAITEMYQKENCDNRTRLCFITSEDLGETWSDVTDLTDKLNEIKNWSTFAVGPGHGIPAESGRLIIPVYAYTSFCCKPCFLPNSKSYALSLYSGSHGKNWKFGELFNTVSVECEIVEISKDHIYCNARNVGGYRVEAVRVTEGEQPKTGQQGLFLWCSLIACCCCDNISCPNPLCLLLVKRTEDLWSITKSLDDYSFIFTANINITFFVLNESLLQETKEKRR
uniref:exo-alpha-sialidase n=1 Tax=Haplochromis burtoni TaxID=8153 RepID=A0A3Q2V412_HAPBU